MQNQINITPIQQFIQLIKTAELSQQKELKIPMQQARLISLALSEVLERANRDWETLYHELKKTSNPDVISVSMDGGGFDNK